METGIKQHQCEVISFEEGKYEGTGGSEEL